MRESFIIHTEYLEDLPEDYKPVFLMHVYNYGAHGIIPKLTGLERTIWVKIQRRIDSDIESWEEVKNARSEAGKKHKGNQYTRKMEQTEQCSNEPKNIELKENTVSEMEQMEQCSNEMEQNGTEWNTTEQNGTEWNTTEQNGTNGTVSVFESVSVSVNESVSESVSVGKDPPDRQPTDLFTKINDWTLKNSLDIADYSVMEIYNYVSNRKFEVAYLDYVLKNVRQKYPDKGKSEIEKIFVKAVFWENLTEEFSRTNTPPPKKKSIFDNAPRICSCGKELQRLGDGSFYYLCCPEHGYRHSFNFEKKIWEEE